MLDKSTGKQARSAEDLCPAGVPLTMPSGDRPFLCGLQVGQPQCPQLFDCIVQPGMSCPLCKKIPIFGRAETEKKIKGRGKPQPGQPSTAKKRKLGHDLIKLK
jgi:hypothetical protein